MFRTRASNKTECAACVGFPVNHAAAYFEGTFSAWNDDQSRALQRLLGTSRFSEWANRSVLSLESFFIRFAHVLGGGRTRKDPDQCPERAKVLWQEARKRGIEFEQLAVFGVPTDAYRFKANGRWVYFTALPVPAAMRARSYAWSDDKALFKSLMQKHDLPTARAELVTDLGTAPEKFARLRAPVVVKPRIGSNSRHTTTFVTNVGQFREAVRTAKQLCKHVLVEEHIPGTLCRATVVDGRLVGFLRCWQPHVTGDGARSIRELVARKNAGREGRVAEVSLTEAHEAHILRQGFSPDDVPQQGTTVSLWYLSGSRVGGQSREMVGEVHPKLRGYVERAANILQTPVVGFDLIIEDPATDPDTQTWGMLEANTIPFIEMHHDPQLGAPSNVAAAIWDLWSSQNKNAASAPAA